MSVTTLTLKRFQSKATGIFSELTDEHGRKLFVTLEHAYPAPSGGWYPKVYNGTYTCTRSLHRLHGMTSDFETFEVTGVSGHSNILFHWGNYNADSEGCILLGRNQLGDMITSSKPSFSDFMALLKGQDSFILEVC